MFRLPEHQTKIWILVLTRYVILFYFFSHVIRYTGCPKVLLCSDYHSVTVHPSRFIQEFTDWSVRQNVPTVTEHYVLVWADTLHIVVVPLDPTVPPVPGFTNPDQTVCVPIAFQTVISGLDADGSVSYTTTLTFGSVVRTTRNTRATRTSSNHTYIT